MGRNKVKEIRRQAVLKAARKLFFEKGFKDVTVESIAKKANVSKGAVYLYFKSKDEIYTQILLTDVDRHQKQMIAILKEGGPAFESLMRIAQSYIDFFMEDRELFRILMTYMLHTDHMDLSEEMDQKLVSAVNKNIDIISQLLQVGIEAGEFPPSINVVYPRNVIWGMLNGIIALHLFTGPEEKREARIRSTVAQGMETYLRGLRESAGCSSTYPL